MSYYCYWFNAMSTATEEKHAELHPLTDLVGVASAYTVILHLSSKELINIFPELNFRSRGASTEKR